jgi:CBS domain-containing protein
MGLHGITVEQDLATAAQCHAGRRAHDRERRIFERLVGLLTARDELFDLAPCRDVQREQGKAEIGAGGEIAALIIDDERLELVVHHRDRLTDQLHHIAVERIHLAGELKAGNAVADIPERRRTILRIGWL